ncbi:hypothetical protein J2O02_11935 [Elizabethkingia anophelis]|uniref:hypothetical protein n=1 Tax=Elizabethkingia anophelis TaxID=1117645 RepID=UPI0020B283F9|nr:hypothetical protein [Elizabethkingia anophelis]UTF99032.1 hypothetical protein J2O04_12225 [Elizabethkingia anophelis]UTG63790.1 hypothetical protein J2O02_11935 [Elizabethkingia anophelis]
MKDENNAFLVIDYKTGDYENRRIRKLQIEVFDKNILCQDCDNRILGRYYEAYAKTVFYGAEHETDIKPQCKNYKNPDDNSEYSICTNFDYKKIKNFLLSLLWRSSITDQSFFDQINLGNKHNERLRHILYENIETSEKEYPILITSFLRTTNTFKSTILKPYKAKHDGLVSYIFFIDGLQYIFFVNSVNHKLPNKLEKFLLNKNQIFINHFRDGMELNILKQFLD